MDWYSKFIFALLVFLLLWMFLSFIFTANVNYHYNYKKRDDNDDDYIDDDINNDNDDNAPNLMFINVEFWIVLFLLIVWGFAFGLNLSIVAANNKSVLYQELELLQRRLCIREHLHSVKNLVFKYSEVKNIPNNISTSTSTLLSHDANQEIIDNDDASSYKKIQKYPINKHSSSFYQYQQQQSEENLENIEANFEEVIYIFLKKLSISREIVFLCVFISILRFFLFFLKLFYFIYGLLFLYIYISFSFFLIYVSFLICSYTYIVCICSWMICWTLQ